MSRKEKPPLVFIVGPTGVGKTTLAIETAQRFGTEILTADSRQIYRLLDIGTAKPTPEEQTLVPHHLIDLIWPDQAFSVADYLRSFRVVQKDFLSSGKIPLVVGGTGLYIQAISRGLFKGPGANPELRRELNTFAKKHGHKALHACLERVDPEAARRIHPHDLRRTIRALEVYLHTGHPISRLQQEETSPEFSSPSLIFGLTRQRRELYDRIEKRAENMLKKGLVEEVRSLLSRGYAESLPALEAFGYRDIIAYLKGKQPLEEALRRLQRDSKRYAKRQLIWFSKEKDIQWFDLSEISTEETLSAMAEEIARLGPTS